ncbi:ribosomal RNA small subunit methyltransferase A [bacterium]|nr:ribosomal RNA small subunit methyltransferase A [bacterium]
MNTKDFNFKKKYGQNFLRDNSIPRKIVDVSKIPDNTLVIEIGPGAGALTKELAKVAKQVLCYEIDESLEDILDQALLEYTNVSVIYDDFLKRNVLEDLNNYDYEHLYVIANLPYYVTTPIITQLVTSNLEIEKIVVMVQKEVADRFCAKPASREYGSITVFLNYYFDLKKEFLVSKNCFVPKPNIDSMIISLTRKKELLPLKDSILFFNLIRDSFRFKRKTLRNNLKGYDLMKIEQTLKNYHFDLSVRAEELPLEVFVDISNNLVK